MRISYNKSLEMAPTTRSMTREMMIRRQHFLEINADFNKVMLWSMLVYVGIALILAVIIPDIMIMVRLMTPFQLYISFLSLGTIYGLLDD